VFDKSDAEVINKMRNEGYGYKAIAKAITSTRDRVRSYCVNHGLNGLGEVVSDNVDIMRTQNIGCVCCSKTINQKKQGRFRKFCSEECRRKWWKDNKESRKQKDTATYKYTCPHCGEGFSSYGNKYRKFCSHDCYIKSRFWKGEEDGI